MDRQIYELSREAHRDDCSREAYKMYYQALEAKIAWMEQEAFAASATIERLREALRPFAEAPIREVDDHDDFDICGTLAENFITIGMLKKARAALGEGK